MERDQKPLFTSPVTRRRLLKGAALLGLAAGDQILFSPADAQTPAALVVAQPADMDTADPAKSTGTATVAILVNVYDTLVRRDADLNLQARAGALVADRRPHDLGVQAAAGREVSQRRGLQRRRRQVHVRPDARSRDALAGRRRSRG